MENYVVNKSIAINAKPGDVWDALTNPEKTKKYFFNSEVHSDWKEGSPITFKGKMLFFIEFEMGGKILEIEPLKLLKYNLNNGKSSGVSTVTDKLTYENEMTVLSITDDVGRGEGAEKRFHKSEKGWDKILKGLKDFLENENRKKN